MMEWKRFPQDIRSTVNGTQALCAFAGQDMKWRYALGEWDGELSTFRFDEPVMVFGQMLYYAMIDPPSWPKINLEEIYFGGSRQGKLEKKIRKEIEYLEGERQRSLDKAREAAVDADLPRYDAWVHSANRIIQPLIDLLERMLADTDP